MPLGAEPPLPGLEQGQEGLRAARARDSWRTGFTSQERFKFNYHLRNGSSVQPRQNKVFSQLLCHLVLAVALPDRRYLSSFSAEGTYQDSASCPKPHSQKEVKERRRGQCSGEKAESSCDEYPPTHQVWDLR